MGLKVDDRFLDLSAYYTALQTDALLAAVVGGSGLTNYYTKTETNALLVTKQTSLSGTGIVKSTAGTISYLTDNSINWDIAYTNRITSLTVTGSSGAATLISNVLNIPTYTLSGLGGQPLESKLTSLSLLGNVTTGLLKYTNGVASYDISTYLTGNQTITLSGDVSGSGETSVSATVTKINGVSLGGLATGILKNTTSTGVPSIAVAGTDYIAGGVGTTNYISKFTASGVLGNSIIFDNGTYVGLGTVLPSARFTIKSSDQTYLGGLHFVNSSISTTWAWVNDSTAALNFGVAVDPSLGANFTTRMILDQYGKLSVNSNVTADAILSLRGVFTGVGNHAMLRFGDVTQTTNYQKGAIIYESVNASSTRGKFHIALENTDGATSVALSDAKLTVLSNGNVGIGNTNPSYNIDVTGTGRFSGLLTATGGITTPVGVGLNFSNWLTYQSGISYYIRDTTNSVMLWTMIGGAGVTGQAILNGSLSVNNTTASTSTGTGSATFGGGIGVAGRAVIYSNPAYTGTITSLSADVGVGGTTHGLGFYNNGNTIELGVIAYGNLVGGFDGYDKERSFKINGDNTNTFLQMSSYLSTYTNNTSYWHTTIAGTSRVIAWNRELRIGSNSNNVSIFSGSGTVASLTASSTKVDFPLTTASTSTTTGALVVSGGVGVAGAGYFGGNIVNGALNRLKGYTVATLPAGTQGDTCFVTDALAPTFLTTVVGGGAIVTTVFYNGTNWIAQ